ncbi:Fatty acid-binding protein DegV-like protein [Mycoplasmopsis maculosa]|uniref:Fatty acid-binding protein DegV-like protein n=1 Tax=Mycoplasmopsis maculosa TaxID=114885 RepID=A0A449B4B3_9BACT|nr:DegV family protein [Mycoplasmopsis maculosa]VEU75409.1 Fatty acid-binding protein DegV-like protein [Mycoplasmopsis maculosa]
MKYAIVVDSSCGLTKAQAEKYGLYYLPLYIDIDNKTYADGIDINSENLFNTFNLKSEVKTSAFNPADAYDLFEKLSKEYDEIIVYPISKHLSSSYSTLATTFKEEFKKLRVIESVQVASLIMLDVIWFKMQLEKDSSKIDEYIKKIEKGDWKRSITLVPKHNKYLVKGGRLHPAAALIAKALGIVPLIKWENGQLLKEGIGRNFLKTILKNISDKSKSFDVKTNNTKVIILHSGANPDELSQCKDQVNKEFKTDPVITYIPSVVSIHTGPEAYATIAFEDENADKILKTFSDIIK